VKIISALLTFSMLAAGAQRAAAQETLAPSLGAGDQPSLRVLEGAPATGDLPVWEENQSLEAIPAPEGDAAEGVAPEGTLLDGSIIGEPIKMLGACPPAYFESSGTWLERGFWYTELDYLFLNRGWDRKGLMLAFETTSGTVPVSAEQFSTINGPVVGTNELRIKGERPGGEGVGRVKLGRFLFRDVANRDHMIEFGWYGGGDWQQSAALQAATTAGLDITDYIDRVNRSFDGARALSFDYSSELNSVEANYILKSRMQRDQMVLEPSGVWVRKATPSRTYSFLGGVRYLNLREELGIDATDVDVDATAAVLREDGDYFIETDNDLFGTQLGAGLSHDTSRWSIGANAKVGAYWNRIDLNSRFQVGETTIANSGVTNSNEDDLSFVGEFQVLGKWHLRPNLSLRAGLECLFIDSIALAPHQINFIPGGYKPIAAAGDSVYLGTSIGLESYW
jgi:hypothetical protein